MIDILMATYNGERYIEQQLESIINQSETNWRLLIRDDCSQDNTRQIIQRYQIKYPDKIIFVPSTEPSGSAMNNFFQLLDYAENEYIMFADQDDVWKPDKIALTLKKMHEMEKQYGKETPLLVHTDLCVVDETLHTINPSIFAMQDMDYRRDKLNNLLVTNIVTGCTMLFNQSVLKFLKEKPKTAVMHDMWIALVASAFGRIGFINEATILYRQHGKNANGAKDVKTVDYINHKLAHLTDVKKNLDLQYQQAGEFLRIYRFQLNEKQKKILEVYSGFNDYHWFGRMSAIFQYGLSKKRFIHVLGQIFC